MSPKGAQNDEKVTPAMPEIIEFPGADPKYIRGNLHEKDLPQQKIKPQTMQKIMLKNLLIFNVAF